MNEELQTEVDAAIEYWSGREDDLTQCDADDIASFLQLMDDSLALESELLVTDCVHDWLERNR